MAGTVKAATATNGHGHARTPKRKSLVLALPISPAIRARYDAIGIKPEPKPDSSTTSQTLPASASIGSPAENASGSSGSSGDTPVPNGVDDSITMPPPAEGVGKKEKNGTKRKSAQADGLLKPPKAKPGPKKRKIDEAVAADSPSAKAGAAAHKLGPKANLGAINAGLRALDRSGAPCRKWEKSGFKLKTFTGTAWEIPRWRAPQKTTVNGQAEESSSSSSGKENKDSSQVDSERSNGIQDAASSNGMPASSPAPAVPPVA